MHKLSVAGERPTLLNWTVFTGCECNAALSLAGSKITADTKAHIQENCAPGMTHEDRTDFQSVVLVEHEKQ